jgi:hypothetical protein
VNSCYCCWYCAMFLIRQRLLVVWLMWQEGRNAVGIPASLPWIVRSVIESTSLYFGMQQVEAPSIHVIDTTKPESDITSVTTLSENHPPKNPHDTARNFVQQSLSTKMYFLSPNARSTGGKPGFQRRSFPPVTSATPLTTVDESGTLRSINNSNSYSRLQAVK